MKFIYVKIPAADRLEIVFNRARNVSYALGGHEINFNGGGNQEARKCILYEVNDNDVDVAVEQISTWHPAADVQVLDPVRLFQRAVGPLVEKKSTKEGVLPI